MVVCLLAFVPAGVALAADAKKAKKPTTTPVYNIKQAYNEERIRDIMEKIKKEEEAAAEAKARREADAQARRDQELADGMVPSLPGDKKKKKKTGMVQETKESPEGPSAKTPDEGEAEAAGGEDGASDDLEQLEQAILKDKEALARALKEMGFEQKEIKEPVLSIDFSSNYVSYERELRQMVTAKDRSPRPPTYQVVSVLPASSNAGSRSYRSFDQYERNLQTVLRRMNDLGVRGERLNVTSRTSDDASGHKIEIYEN